MEETRFALSTNDYKNLSNDSFGQSHYFQVYRITGNDEVTLVDTLENVLFMQACDIQGRAEHLHGLLSEVPYLMGHGFEEQIQQKLTNSGHVLIEVKPGKLDHVLEQIKNGELLPGQTKRN
ncbi:MAG: hypothetical protein K9N46_15065 [Candidatus Marinimicrobia bacterium]|nr:hypothetical protein [Candidatus Neomarinimicrobiota bacterium]MCF7828525.1 hypothetical protein [Candidatus Neomarinimicrobiota bacterium]MCF7882052.1 hypothetical protein [Candidatus Neomarinimicrobiota bacterium]